MSNMKKAPGEDSGAFLLYFDYAQYSYVQKSGGTYCLISLLIKAIQP